MYNSVLTFEIFEKIYLMCTVFLIYINWLKLEYWEYGECRILSWLYFIIYYLKNYLQFNDFEIKKFN